MSIELRFPNITGSTEREQLAQVKSYLYQLTEQLQWALENVSATPASYVVNQTQRSESSSSSSQTPSFDAEVAFADLKPLIIKSADIVEAYYEEINTRLKGLYVAESDFGTFVQETGLVINQSSTGIEQEYTNVQKIITDLDILNTDFINTTAYIKSGLIDYDDNEIPIYGLEIGQKDETSGEMVNRFARFTSDRLSFYDQNGYEVAYFSNYRLFIRNVEITTSFKVGGFVDTVSASGDVVTKWVGGDE